ncbi:DUF4835 family protein [Ichthyenterobacterium sp. W332]|uniref:DUF4835 family protein n=1 Tax=Microcosmobacter mediterraneus TaxID=3075607 RepID=A0ABU2YHA4_9FLAO|nr:DUF4835 family protein [Ichthyenterobacterium sp. W332]MDT0557539.1 DUF4835 family protein [Ichthyenterobacterium sp. W332]
MRKFLLVLCVAFATTSYSQELNCNFVVNAQLTGNENVQVFKTLENQLREFINTTEWTDKNYKPQERIDCSMVLTIQNYNNDSFEATLQIQSSRPVFNSAYSTSLYNFNDQDFNFKYLEFQNLVYNPNQFSSNLISVLTFHIYMILGIDADSFSKNGGDEYFRQAQIILQYSQDNNAKGWKLQDGRQTRFTLITDLLSQTFKEYRDVMYNYHRVGLDTMSEDVKGAKNNIAKALNNLNALNQRRPNSFLMRVFFDAKADEIKDIFSGGPSVNITDLITTLNKVAPMHSAKWRDISF